MGAKLTRKASSFV